MVSKKLSVLIPTLNEEKNLRELLPMLQWADEIVVVDSFSQDATVEVAKELNARVLQHEYINPSLQKNWAIPQMANEWIFLLDADERPTQELLAEIQAFRMSDSEPTAAAFWIGRQNFFMGQLIRHSGWSGDKVVRLFHRDKCRCNDKRVHEEIETQEKVGYLQSKILHYTYISLDHFIDKLQRYATWAAEDYADKTARVGYFHLWLKPVFRFFKHFLLQKGFLDGRIGFIISVLMAFGVFLRYAKLRELQQQKKG